MNNKLITSLALVALIALSIPLTLLILQSNSLDFNINAFESPVPQNITIADQTDSSFNVLWTTEKQVSGGINIDGIPLYEENSAKTHKIKVNIGKPATEKQFSILSDGLTYPEDGSTFFGRTASIPPINQPTAIIFGQIIDKDGLSFLKEGFVSLKISNNSSQSQLLSSVINEFGGYQFVFSNILNQDLNDLFDTSGVVDVELSIYTADAKTPVVRKFTQDINNTSQIPNIYLAEPEINLIPGIQGN